MSLLQLVAQTTSDDPPGTILGIPPEAFNIAQLGLFGVLAVAIITKRFLVPAWALTDQEEGHQAELALKNEQIAGLKADVADLKATVNVLQSAYSDKVIPALVDANRLTAAYVSEISRRTT